MSSSEYQKGVEAGRLLVLRQLSACSSHPGMGICIYGPNDFSWQHVDGKEDLCEGGTNRPSLLAYLDKYKTENDDAHVAQEKILESMGIAT